MHEVTQIVAQRQAAGRVEALVQWACTWVHLHEVVQRARVLGHRTQNGRTEVLLQWDCSWEQVGPGGLDPHGPLWLRFVSDAGAAADHRVAFVVDQIRDVSSDSDSVVLPTVKRRRRHQ